MKAEGWRETPLVLANPGTDEWAGALRRRGDRVARILRARMGRPVRDVAPRGSVEVRSRPGRFAGAAGRRAGGARSGGPRGSDRQRRPRRGLAVVAGGCHRRHGTDRRPHDDRHGRGSRGDDARVCGPLGGHGLAGLSRVGRSGARAHRRLVRDVSAVGGARPDAQRDVPRGGQPPAGHRRPGLRRRVSAAGPSNRPKLPERAQQQPRRAAGRSGKPVGHRVGRRRPHGGRTGARDARRLRGVPRGSRTARPGDRDRSRVAILARSSVGARTPRLVPPSARRHDQVRGEPAEEIPGHLPARLRVGRLAGAVAGAPRGHDVLGRSRRAHLPRRQPPHQDARVLGVAHPRGAGPRPARALPRPKRSHARG